jgi:uncharacterized protein
MNANASIEIQEKLRAIAASHDVVFLYAVESGSRAYGFDSSDSDYDIRGIYVQPKEKYLRIDEAKDEIRITEGDKDYVFWDIRKALRLLVASNPSMLDWLTSPIIYRSLDGWISKFCDLSKHYWMPVKYFHANYHLAKGHYRKYIVGKDTVEAKVYLYTLRALAACRHVCKAQLPPRVDFDFSYEYPDHQPSILELIRLKKTGTETGIMQADTDLNSLISNELSDLERRDFATTTQPNLEHANAFFRSLF